MPTVNDATVVSGSGYSTIGNGGRKLVRLDNGTLVAVIKNTTSSSFIFYKSINNGNTWSILYNTGTGTLTSIQDVALVPFGAKVFLIQAYNNAIVTYRSIDVATGASNDAVAIDTSQTALGNVSLAINEAKTELHAAWTSKNSTYPNAFNMRYAKGTINADGTVTWGTVEQLTRANSSGLEANPSIIVNKDGYPIIAHEYNNGTNTNLIECHMFNGTRWIIGKTIYRNDGYTQSSPSAIYVPQSINGLANGRIWVAWNGSDNTNNVSNIKMSYSDDNGDSWANVINVTTENKTQAQPTISCNNRNEIFIVWQGIDSNVSSSYYNIRKIKYTNGTLSAIETMTNNTSSSAMYANSLSGGSDIDSPLFIYTNSQTSSVNFYGSWANEKISPPVGERGKILNRQNILTYNITYGSAIGTVTEKINGVVVGTKTLASGQNTTINITQSQWDSIPYGKYRNNSAGRNTIEIVTSNNTFIYTFEKWFDNTLDVISVTKAVKDSKDYYLPSAKKILSDAINSKGGSTTPTDSIESMANGISSVLSIKKATGNSISSSQTVLFARSNGNDLASYYFIINIETLGFEPRSIQAISLSSDVIYDATFYFKDKIIDVSATNYSNYYSYDYGANNAVDLREYKVGNNLYIPIRTRNVNVKWTAYE